MNLTPKLLALGLALFAMAPAAQAQRSSRGGWQVRATQHTKAGRISIHAGSRGFGVDLTHHRRPRQVTHHSTRHVHGARCRHIAGHYDLRSQQVWVPGHTERVWVPAEYETTCDPYGRRSQRVVFPAHYEVIQHPGYYETRQTRVWVPARYECYGGGISAYPPRRRW